MGKAKLRFSHSSRAIKRKQKYALILLIIRNAIKDLKLLIFNKEMMIYVG